MTQPKSKEKTTYIDYEEIMSLENATSFLEKLVKKLKEKKSFTLTQDDKTHEVKPSSCVEVEVKFAEENGKYEFELEIEWTEDKDGKGLQIG